MQAGPSHITSPRLVIAKYPIMLSSRFISICLNVSGLPSGYACSRRLRRCRREIAPHHRGGPPDDDSSNGSAAYSQMPSWSKMSEALGLGGFGFGSFGPCRMSSRFGVLPGWDVSSGGAANSQMPGSSLTPPLLCLQPLTRPKANVRNGRSSHMPVGQPPSCFPLHPLWQREDIRREKALSCDSSFLAERQGPATGYRGASFDVGGEG